MPCSQTVQHGFPHRASALSWDPLLRLAALGTATGALKVYGRPGVEFYGQHTNPEAAIIQIKFIPGEISINSPNITYKEEFKGIPTSSVYVDLKPFTVNQ